MQDRGLFDADAGVFDGFVPAEKYVGEICDIVIGEAIFDREGKFVNHGVGFWCDDCSTKNFALIISDDFDKAVFEVRDIAARNLAERCEGFFDFEVLFHGVVFADADRSNHWEGCGDARHYVVVGRDFVAFCEVVRGYLAFIHGASGGAFATDTVACGVDMFGGSLEMVVDFDAFAVVFDFGIFET